MKSRTKQSSSSTALTATTKTTASCESPKHYPSISAAYWLPAPNPTPYLLPGKEKLTSKNKISAVLIILSKAII